MRATHEDKLQNLVDRAEISDLLIRYCHAIDRLDRPLLEATYWPDATDHHGTFSGSAAGFVDWVVEYLAPFKTQHFIGNSWIQFDSPTTAQGQTYVVAVHLAATTFGAEELTYGARYLDRFEKRGDEWRIKERTVVVDYSRTGTSDLHRDDSLPCLGGRAPNDPFYRILSMTKDGQ